MTPNLKVELVMKIAESKFAIGAIVRHRIHDFRGVIFDVDPEFDNSDEGVCDIFKEMPNIIEDRGENNITEFGPSGPHPRLQEMFGSLLRPGNITTIVARSGVGKTNFVMDFCTKVSLKHSIPVIHFDNGEMSKEELIMNNKIIKMKNRFSNKDRKWGPPGRPSAPTVRRSRPADPHF